MLPISSRICRRRLKKFRAVEVRNLVHMAKDRPTPSIRRSTSDVENPKSVFRRGTSDVGRRTSVLTRSADETHQLGIRLGRSLRVPCVVLLRGPLGVGKTTLTRGIAEGLGLEDPRRVSSPSFALVNTYRGRCLIYHVDLYRLEGARDLYTTGLDEFLGREGVTIVEWSERLTFYVESALIVDIEDAGGDTRIFKISASESIRGKPTGTSGRNGPAHEAGIRCGPRKKNI